MHHFYDEQVFNWYFLFRLVQVEKCQVVFMNLFIIFQKIYFSLKNNLKMFLKTVCIQNVKKKVLFDVYIT